MAGALRHRLQSKTLPPIPSQNALPDAVELGAEARDDCKRRMYLITFPHPRQTHVSTGERLVAPGNLPKKEMIEKVLNSRAIPIDTNTWLAQGGVQIMGLMTAALPKRVGTFAGRIWPHLSPPRDPRAHITA